MLGEIWDLHPTLATSTLLAAGLANLAAGYGFFNDDEPEGRIFLLGLATLLGFPVWSCLIMGFSSGLQWVWWGIIATGLAAAVFEQGGSRIRK